MSDETTRPNEATKAADRADAKSAHDADRAPTPEEEREAEGLSLDDDVADHEREMIERGARQKGEGRLP